MTSGRLPSRSVSGMSNGFSNDSHHETQKLFTRCIDCG